MTVSSLGASTSAYSYLQSLLPQRISGAIVCLAVQGERPMLYCFCAQPLRPNNNRKRVLPMINLPGVPDLHRRRQSQGCSSAGENSESLSRKQRKKGSPPRAKLVLTIPGFNHICASLEQLSWAQ